MTDQDQRDQQGTEEEVVILHTVAVFKLPDALKSGQPLALEPNLPAPTFVGYHQAQDSYRIEREAVRAVATEVGRYIAVKVHSTEEDDYYHPGVVVSLEVL